jgi:hypothetical protein
MLARRNGRETLHVHIHAGAQAIVGAVTHTGGPRALIENPNNPGPIVASDGQEMWSQNPDRETVPVPMVKGRKRCRMHGGAQGSGAPSDERNGNYRHGLYTTEAIAERKAIRARLRSIRKETR